MASRLGRGGPGLGSLRFRMRLVRVVQILSNDGSNTAYGSPDVPSIRIYKVCECAHYCGSKVLHARDPSLGVYKTESRKLFLRHFSDVSYSYCYNLLFQTSYSRICLLTADFLTL